MQFVWRYIDDFMGKGLEFLVILELIFYAAIAILPMSLPLAVLFASILTLGNLGEKSELTALKVAGLSLNQILRPLLGLVTLITLCAFLFSSYLLPLVRIKFNRILYDVSSTRPAFHIEEKIFYREIEGLVLRVNSKDKVDKNLLYDLLIYDYANKNAIEKNFRITVAKKGKLSVVEYDQEKRLSVELFDGNIYEDNYTTYESYKNHPHKQYSFKKMEKLIDMPGFNMKNSDEDNFKNDYGTENFIRLTQGIDSLEGQERVTKNNSLNFWKNRLLFFEKPQIEICYPEVIAKEFSDSLAQFLPFLSKDADSILLKTYKESLKNFIQMTIQSAQFPLIDREERLARHIRLMLIEWHFRITFPLICMVMFFIGAPMGAITKKGGLGLPILFSVLFFIIFYVTDTFSKNSAQDGNIASFLSHWTAFAVLIPIAFYLNYVAKKEIGITDLVPFKKYYNKFVSFFRKNDKKMTKKMLIYKKD